MNEKISKINRALEVIRKLPSYLEACRQRSPGGSIPLDYATNRCMKRIEEIRSFAPLYSAKLKRFVKPRTEIQRVAVKALEEAYEHYETLQKYDAPSGERQDYMASRETSFDALNEDDLWIDEGVVHESSPDVYAGGLGYKHVNWDSSYLMGTAKKGARSHYGYTDGYFNPKEATPKPVKHYTKEEIEKLHGSSG